MIGNNWIALVLTFGLALGWLRLNDFLAHKGIIDGQLSRKIIHMGTGPIFVLCWLLFTNSAESRYLAALVPFAITIQFALVGLGIMKDPEAVAAMSRHGDRREILRGPHEVGRVIARPFTGAPGSFARTSNRHDYAVPPPAGMLLDRLNELGVEIPFPQRVMHAPPAPAVPAVPATET